MTELRRRFGTAAPDVLDAYTSASGVISRIVAVHLADPNMYIPPEINPGGLIDGYKTGSAQRLEGGSYHPGGCAQPASST